MPLLAAQGASEKTEKIDVSRLVPENAWGRMLASKENKRELSRPASGVTAPTASPSLAQNLVTTESNTTSDTQWADVATAVAREKGRRIDVTQLARGRKVFANNCIACHSSVQWPERDRILTEEAVGAAGAGKKPAELWDHDPGRWMQDPGYKAWAEGAVETPEFWRNNYLSADYRVPISLVRTNSARGLATNALGRMAKDSPEGHMWEDFSSDSYKQMPFVGEIRYFDPFEGKEKGFTPQHKPPFGSPLAGGGVGFYRPPTLVSIWTTAPLLHNNSLGLFNNDPSVNGRLDAFDDAIRKLLWPAKRFESSSFNGATPERLKKDRGLIWRTPQVTHLNLPGEQVPGVLAQLPVVGKLAKWYAQWKTDHPAVDRVVSKFPWLPSALLFVAAYVCFVRLGRAKDPDTAEVLRRKQRARVLGYLALLAGLVIGALIYVLGGRLGTLRIGPIPKGTPVNLLANMNPDAGREKIQKTLSITLDTLADIESRHLSEAEGQQLLREKVAPALMSVSKCPDFVMDEGHYFKWFDSMTEEDKNALIELLKTF
jgi:mono/diheme cytochrome c family protein